MAHGLSQEALLDRKPDPQVFRPHDFRGIRGHRVRHALLFGGQQLLRIGMLRVGKDVRRPALLDDLAALHDADPVGDPAHDAKVMGDEQKA